MKRTTVMLPDDVDARLRYEARRRGVPVSDLVREAVAAYVAGPPRRLGFTGVGESSRKPLSKDARTEVRRAIAKRQRS